VRVLAGEQAVVFSVVVVFGPESLEGFRVLNLRLGRPGRGDLRSVQAVTRPDLGGENLTGGRNNGLGPGVQRVLQAADRGWGKHPDLRRRRAMERVAGERVALERAVL